MVYDSANSFESSIKYDYDAYINSTLDSNVAYVLSPSLTYSTNPSDIITYSLGDYLSQSPPSWASVNSSTGKMSLNTPILSAAATYWFSIVTQISGKPSSVIKPIYLTVSTTVPWNVQNCKTWVNKRSTVWSECLDGFTLYQGNQR